jgi:hypothetical protein
MSTVASYPGALDPIQYGTCPNPTCGATVELLFDHELEQSPLCGPCFEVELNDEVESAEAVVFYPMRKKAAALAAERGETA